MKNKFVLLIKRITGGLICLCMAALFVLFQTWLILELRSEPQIVSGDAYSSAAVLTPTGQYESWEYWARADEALRSEFMQTMSSNQDDMGWSGFEYGRSGDEQSP